MRFFVGMRCTSITALLIAALLTGCSSEKNEVSSYDDCILEYVKPSMGVDAIGTVRASCDRKFPGQAPERQSTQITPSQTIQEKRETCFNQAAKLASQLKEQIWAEQGCVSSSQLTEEKAGRCMNFSREIDSMQREDEARCTAMFR